MTPNVLGLTVDLMSNFVTVTIPSLEWSWDRTIVDYDLTADMVEEYRGKLRRELSRHGEVRCLDHMEIDRLGNWHVHFFPLNEEAITVLANAVAKMRLAAWGSGEAATFDPREFVLCRLDRLEKQGRLRGRDPWWIDESGV
jgi:hypothetical protein